MSCTKGIHSVPPLLTSVGCAVFDPKDNIPIISLPRTTDSLMIVFAALLIGSSGIDPVISSETCTLLGKNIKTSQVMEYPKGYNISDTLTVKWSTVDMNNGYLFYLLNQNISNETWNFYLNKDGSLGTSGICERELHLAQSAKSFMQVQIYHDRETDAFNILAPNSRTILHNYSYNSDMLLFNTVTAGMLRNTSYEYFSLCKPEDPRIELTATPQPYVVGTTVTLACKITGPPFLSGYWTKNGAEVVTGKFMELERVLDESKAEHELHLTVVLPRLQLGHLGLYTCHAANSITPHRITSKNVYISTLKMLKITSPETRHYKSLPATFTWRIDGYMIQQVELTCSAGNITSSSSSARDPLTSAVNPPDRPPSRVFHVTITVDQSQDTMYCKLSDNGTVLRRSVLARCKEGSFMEEEKFCVPCFPEETCGSMRNGTKVGNGKLKSEDFTFYIEKKPQVSA